MAAARKGRGRRTEKEEKKLFWGRTVGRAKALLDSSEVTEAPWLQAAARQQRVSHTHTHTHINTGTIFKAGSSSALSARSSLCLASHL